MATEALCRKVSFSDKQSPGVSNKFRGWFGRPTRVERNFWPVNFTGRPLNEKVGALFWVAGWRCSNEPGLAKMTIILRD
jgi:hypothetical protein